MQIGINKKGACCIISYEGDTKDLTPGPFPAVLKALQSGDQKIILDFKNLGFLNPTAVKALKESADIIKGGEARIGISEPNPHVRQIIKLNGLSADFPIYYNEKEAMKWISMLDYSHTMAKNVTADHLLILQKDLPIARELRKSMNGQPLHLQARLIPCRDFESAHEVLMEERIDCILLDCGFSFIKVTEFIEKVGSDRRLPDIPFLVVTPDEQLMDAYRIVRNGAHEIIRFPFKDIEIMVRLQNLICHVKDHRPFHAPHSIFRTGSLTD
jgi:anti-sigma B factor antagonist